MLETITDRIKRQYTEAYSETAKRDRLLRYLGYASTKGDVNGMCVAFEKLAKDFFHHDGVADALMREWGQLLWRGEDFKLNASWHYALLRIVPVGNKLSADIEKKWRERLKGETFLGVSYGKYTEIWAQASVDKDPASHALTVKLEMVSEILNRSLAEGSGSAYRSAELLVKAGRKDMSVPHVHEFVAESWQETLLYMDDATMLSAIESALFRKDIHKVFDQAIESAAMAYLYDDNKALGYRQQLADYIVRNAPMFSDIKPAASAFIGEYGRLGEDKYVMPKTTRPAPA